MSRVKPFMQIAQSVAIAFTRVTVNDVSKELQTQCHTSRKIRSTKQMDTYIPQLFSIFNIKYYCLNDHNNLDKYYLKKSVTQ